MRTEQIKNYIANGMFAVCPRFLESMVDTINSGEIAKIETNNAVSPAHSYEERGNIAIISVDGAMTKKNTFMNALCAGFPSYDVIASYIDKAENNPAISTIVFNVDTVGGDVAGADNLGEKIFNSKKQTITYYDNIGASAGMWIFSASKQIFANKTAMLGSIGVMSGYMDKQENDGRVVLVSKNAKNKNCAINGDCKNKIQARIDAVEEIFFQRIERNTSFSKEQIIEYFGAGDVISADEALKIGFIKQILSFDELLSSLATMPASSENSNFKMGVKSMDETQFQALLDAKSKELAEVGAELTTAKDNFAKVSAELAKAKDEADKAKSSVKDIVAMAFEHGVSKEVAISMVETGSTAEAALLALKAKESDGASTQGDLNDAESGEVALADLVNFGKKLKV